ncbi:protein kinase domain-containing protein [Facilibium subflavum]|uniref:protein kinase domain-containing protein n=1 Tax=Facilibium subflavum TaxID=2219058 RepID=UPI000E65E18F|nr:hypothetical protein [Facilibium subflavum]
MKLHWDSPEKRTEEFEKAAELCAQYPTGAHLKKGLYYKLNDGSNYKFTHSFLKTHNGMLALPDMKQNEQYAKLGQGGFGKVKLCEMKDGTKVALKVNNLSLLAATNEIAALQNLGLAGEKVDHMKFGYEYIPMTYLGKQNLASVIHNNTLTKAQKADLSLLAIDALYKLHQGKADVRYSQKLAHMDIKPENIMVSKDLSKVTLIDFGLSTLLDDGYPQGVGGTPHYMHAGLLSVMQGNHQAVDVPTRESADHFALCRVLFMPDLGNALDISNYQLQYCDLSGYPGIYKKDELPQHLYDLLNTSSGYLSQNFSMNLLFSAFILHKLDFANEQQEYQELLSKPHLQQALINIYQIGVVDRELYKTLKNSYQLQMAINHIAQNGKLNQELLYALVGVSKSNVKLYNVRQGSLEEYGAYLQDNRELQQAINSAVTQKNLQLLPALAQALKYACQMGVEVYDNQTNQLTEIGERICGNFKLQFKINRAYNAASDNEGKRKEIYSTFYKDFNSLILEINKEVAFIIQSSDMDQIKKASLLKTWESLTAYGKYQLKDTIDKVRSSGDSHELIEALQQKANAAQLMNTGEGIDMAQVPQADKKLVVLIGCLNTMNKGDAENYYHELLQQANDKDTTVIIAEPRFFGKYEVNQKGFNYLQTLGEREQGIKNCLGNCQNVVFCDDMEHTIVLNAIENQAFKNVYVYNDAIFASQETEERLRQVPDNLMQALSHKAGQEGCHVSLTLAQEQLRTHIITDEEILLPGIHIDASSSDSFNQQLFDAKKLMEVEKNGGNRGQDEERIATINSLSKGEIIFYHSLLHNNAMPNSPPTPKLVTQPIENHQKLSDGASVSQASISVQQDKQNQIRREENMTLDDFLTQHNIPQQGFTEADKENFQLFTEDDMSLFSTLEANEKQGQLRIFLDSKHKELENINGLIAALQKDEGDDALNQHCNALSGSIRAKNGLLLDTSGDPLYQQRLLTRGDGTCGIRALLAGFFAHVVNYDNNGEGLDKLLQACEGLSNSTDEKYLELRNILQGQKGQVEQYISEIKHGQKSLKDILRQASIDGNKSLLPESPLNSALVAVSLYAMEESKTSSGVISLFSEIAVHDGYGSSFLSPSTRNDYSAYEIMLLAEFLNINVKFIDQEVNLANLLGKDQTHQDLEVSIAGKDRHYTLEISDLIEQDLDKVYQQNRQAHTEAQEYPPVEKPAINPVQTTLEQTSYERIKKPAVSSAIVDERSETTSFEAKTKPIIDPKEVQESTDSIEQPEDNLSSHAKIQKPQEPLQIQKNKGAFGICG